MHIDWENGENTAISFTPDGNIETKTVQYIVVQLTDNDSVKLLPAE